MKTQSQHYIFPPRAENCIPRNQADIYFNLGWKAQIKYNDTRLLIKYLPNKVELWNRHGMRINYTPPPELQEQLQTLKDKLYLNDWSLIDGGLLDAKHPAIKDQIVIWDILVKNGEHLLGTTYEERYAQIAAIGDNPHHYDPYHKKHRTLDIGISITSDIFYPRWYDKEQYNNLWNLVETANAPYPTTSPIFEGCVLKDPLGTLTVGYKAKNNTEWMAKSRVTTGRHKF